MCKQLFTKGSIAQARNSIPQAVSLTRTDKDKRWVVPRVLIEPIYFNVGCGNLPLKSMRVVLTAWLILISTQILVPDAMAESIYKSVMPDGRVMYGQQPQPGARTVKKSTVDTSNTGVKPLSKTEIESIERRAQERSRVLDETLKSVQTAEADLRVAEIDREAGIEPLPGERLGIVGRGTRLSEAYWRRQQILEEHVEATRQLLKNARQGYNDAR
ncbi:MAG: DUF4124 domain-containing protein [Nitrosomonadaceae bacterium]